MRKISLYLIMLLGVASAQQSTIDAVISEPSGDGPFRSGFAGIVVPGAVALPSDEARRFARELLSLAQVSISVKGDRATHGLCQANAVEVMHLSADADFAVFRGEARDAGFSIDDVSLQERTPFQLFTLKKAAREVLGSWMSRGETNVLMLCQTRRD